MTHTYAFHLAEHEPAARLLALTDLNRSWRTDYDGFDDLVADSDAFSLGLRAGDDLHRALVERLAEMVEDGRLAEITSPADHAWLVAAVEALS